MSEKQKTVTLVSPNKEHEIELPESEPAEITNLRAQGWATKQEQAATERAEKKAEGAK